MERMEKGIYTEGFFNLTDDNLYKSQVVKDIDNNKAQLLKTDAKFYAIHVSPSTKELQAMGNTEQEQAEAMKRYIREVFVPEYAKNFNKGLTENDIKFYGKIHFDRDSTRSDNNNQNNMHCHIIVSRKDQANKIKLSPLTNHRDTKKGTVIGGFDRTNLFQQAEKGFDRLFNYDRQFTESFEYCNTMKNGSIADQLNMQEKMLTNQDENMQIGIDSDRQMSKDVYKIESKFANSQNFNIENTQTINQENKESINLPDLGLSSALGLFTPDVSNKEEEQIPLKKKKPKPKRGFQR